MACTKKFLMFTLRPCQYDLVVRSRHTLGHGQLLCTVSSDFQIHRCKVMAKKRIFSLCASWPWWWPWWCDIWSRSWHTLGFMANNFVKCQPDASNKQKVKAQTQYFGMYHLLISIVTLTLVIFLSILHLNFCLSHKLTKYLLSKWNFLWPKKSIEITNSSLLPKENVW